MTTSEKAIVSSGMLFLKTYSKLAELAASRPLFTYGPKTHFLRHVILELQAARLKRVAGLNLLSVSCSAAKDFVGRTALLSRRVSAMTCETRVLQRWLAGAQVQRTS